MAGQSSAGNPVSVSHPFTVDLTAVAISINTVASDDVINAAEKGTDLTFLAAPAELKAGKPLPSLLAVKPTPQASPPTVAGV
ncbi:hypothetical protein O5707_07305 [Escherichia coli]|nr:hypothetical protein [Escherichia coli]